jgi:tRNA(Arg) A34 adenosine deaminase TadA
MKIRKYIIKRLLFLRNHNPYGNPFSAYIYNTKTKREIFCSNLVFALKDPTAHAEMIALRNLRQVANPEDCYIISSGEPCPMCLCAIAWAGIKNVYYLNDYLVAIREGFNFDQNSLDVNRWLGLGLNIRKIDARTGEVI